MLTWVIDGLVSLLYAARNASWIRLTDVASNRLTGVLIIRR